MTLDLTIAIPAHNDTQLLARLLSRLAQLRLAQHVIVVDDGSDPAIDARTLCQTSGFDAGVLTLLRQDAPQGAGAARNLALHHVTTSHLLFLDADDLPTRELRDLVRALPPHAADFDFCLFQHHDSRMERDTLWGQMDFDQRLWTQAGLAQGALHPVTETAAQLLAQTANYPWNKIYRSDFLREHGIRCSTTLVHNDIALHWRSFLHGTRILASDHVGVIHFVHPAGRRLTNQLGAERLQVFIPLEQVALEITATQSPYAPAFFGFVLGLLDWAHGTLHHSLRPQFLTTGTSFLNRYLSQSLRQQLLQDRPADWQRATELFDLET